MGATSGGRRTDIEVISKPVVPRARADLNDLDKMARDDQLSRPSLPVLAFLALVVGMQQGMSPAPAAALVGVVLVVLVYLHPDAAGKLSSRPLYLGTLLALGTLWVAAPSFLQFPHPPDLPILAFGIIPVAIGVWLETISRFDQKRVRALLIAAIAGVALIGAALIISSKNFGIDVLVLHKEAAAAIADGVSPYGPAVNVANGAPTAEPGARIIGYPYPPVIALVFSIGEWLLGEPRWGGLAAWVAALAVLAVWGVEIRSRATVRFALLLMLIPWPFLVLAGFTESVTVVFLALSASLWRQHPVASSTLLGLALSTKQYLLVLLPILLFAPIMRGRRTVVALGVAGAALIPALFPDPASAWEALIAFHVDTLPRFDSPNLIGLFASLGYAISIPPAIGLISALIVAGVIAKHIANPSSLFAAIALTLSVFLFLINQTNANYWILILVLLALTQGAGDASSDERDARVSSAQIATR